MTSQDNTSNQELTDLRARIEELESQVARPRSLRRSNRLVKWGALALALAGIVTSSSALSQEMCDPEGELPEPFYTFCPGAAASAFEVNWNFRELLGLVDDKLDKVSTERLYVNAGVDAELDRSGSIVVGAENGANLTVDGNEILSRNDGMGSTLYINASESGSATSIGSGGDETRLTVNGNVNVNGTLTRDCPTDMTQIGDRCIDNEINPVMNYGAALRECAAKSAHICSPLDYAVCDHVEPAGSTCTAHTDDAAYIMWTGQMMVGSYDALAFHGNNDQTVVDGGTTRDFYCCTSL